MRFFTEFILSEKRRFFASLRMTGEGLRMTGKGLRMAKRRVQNDKHEIVIIMTQSLGGED